VGPQHGSGGLMDDDEYGIDDFAGGGILDIEGCDAL
jgi:hypothetical protein